MMDLKEPTQTPPDVAFGEDLRQRLEEARKAMEFHQAQIREHTRMFEESERIAQACVNALEVLDGPEQERGPQTFERSAGPITVR
jgi:hypothetical protein